MKKTLLAAMAVSMLLSGCGSNYMMANNGEYYKKNSTCVTYEIKANKMICYNKQGQFMGKMLPVNPNVVQEERYQQAQTNQALITGAALVGSAAIVSSSYNRGYYTPYRPYGYYGYRPYGY